MPSRQRGGGIRAQDITARSSIRGIIRPGDPQPVREYVALAAREGFTPLTIDQGRAAIIRYIKWLDQRDAADINGAGLKEFIAYRTHLLKQPISRFTAQNYLRRITGYYFLRMRRTGDERQLELCEKLRTVYRGFKGRQRYESHKPFSPDTLRKILVAARQRTHLIKSFHIIEAEDYVFLLTLLYTGARAGIYGLRVDEVHLREHEIRTHVKGGGFQVIPLHPALERALRRHLAQRKYRSGYVFRWGRDERTFHGAENNCRNAQLICERARAAAGLHERVTPHRFRATLATMLRQSGMKLENVQALLGHRDPLTTLRAYVNVEWHSLRRDFASIELDPEARRPRSEQAMRRLAPEGTQHGWDLVVRGLLDLTASGSKTTSGRAAASLRHVLHRGEG